MPVQSDFAFIRYDDGILVVSMAPPQPVGGWNIQFQLSKRFGSESGYLRKSCASGFNGVSGITVTNSGNGTFNIALNSADTSGYDQGCYAYEVSRMDSGYRTLTTFGYVLLE